MKQKMTQEDVEIAMKLIASGKCTQADITRRYKVSRQYVSQLCEKHGIDTGAARRKFKKKLDKLQLETIRINGA